MKRRTAKSKSLKGKQPFPRVEDETDERVVRSKEAVLAATHELLSEAGLGGVSVDAVSRRSKVAKTTIYRHWPTRTALSLDACSKMGTKPEVPDTGSLEGDITALAMGIAERLQTARWPSVLPSVIDAAERDPEIKKCTPKCTLEGLPHFGVSSSVLSDAATCRTITTHQL